MAATIVDVAGRYRRYVETSAANTALTMAVAPGVAFRVLHSETTYSAAPTQAGVTHVINSGAGAGYDHTIDTGAANARYTSYMPTDLTLASDDGFDVTAPAGGAGITGAIAVVVELL